MLDSPLPPGRARCLCTRPWSHVQAHLDPGGAGDPQRRAMRHDRRLRFRLRRRPPARGFADGSPRSRGDPRDSRARSAAAMGTATVPAATARPVTAAATARAATPPARRSFLAAAASCSTAKRRTRSPTRLGLQLLHESRPGETPPGAPQRTTGSASGTMPSSPATSPRSASVMTGRRARRRPVRPATSPRKPADAPRVDRARSSIYRWRGRGSTALRKRKRATSSRFWSASRRRAQRRGAAPR